MRRLISLATLLLLVSSACRRSTAPTDDVPTELAHGPTLTSLLPSPSPTSSATSPRPVPLARVRVHMQQVATLESPLAMATRPGDPALYIAEQIGRVVALRGLGGEPVTVLDISSSVSSGGEQGLLGLAFSDDGQYLYVNYTDLNGDTRIVEYAFRYGRLDPSSRRDVLFVDQPYSNHNGGNLVFGPDGYLYIGLGDGGGAGDPQGNGQNLGTLLGKMLRIDPRPANGRPYGVPHDNPFVGRAGARGEIWAYGLRNPWRFEFDRATGDLWIGDVGQGSWEEIDVSTSGSGGGQNYGWNRLEGTHPYQGGAPANAVPPVYEYSHDEGGCAVTGGFVYRGRVIRGLAGAYLFSDYCGGEVMALRRDGGRLTDGASLNLRLLGPASFGQDQDGELYVLSLTGPVYKLVP